MKLLRIVVMSVLTAAGVAAVIAIPRAAQTPSGPFEHVLLLSIDGMHASDLDWYVANHPNSTLAQLSATGRTYTNASATKPSDSFPGMLAMVTGGTPKSTGVYYDDGYDRGLIRFDLTCESVMGTQVLWKQNLDEAQLDAFGNPVPWLTVIKDSQLPLNPNVFPCARVQPYDFPRVNNVFEIVTAAGGHTAWSDKHPAYKFLRGRSVAPIDLFTPEIASCDGILVGTAGCTSARVTTNFFSKTIAYDSMKVEAIINEIDGFDHARENQPGVPTVFGMNFQAVSVGQKLDMTTMAECTAGKLADGLDCKGGYLADGTPSSPLQRALEETDKSIGRMVDELRSQGLLDSTLIIVSAKHGNSPIDPQSLVRVNPAWITNLITCNTTASCGTLLPPKAQVSADTGPLIWIIGAISTEDAVAVLDANRGILGIAGGPGEGILWGNAIAEMFADPASDDRAPDIILKPNPGTLYSTSATKIADHGSFNDDDVHVALLVSNPGIVSQTISTAVETRQIACTILDALGMSCSALESQTPEPSTALPYDSTPPVLTLPPNIMTDATSLTGTTVPYVPEPTATDLVDGQISPTCDPASGSTFGIGTFTVTCTATDKAGNVATGSFSVVVLVTPQILQQELALDDNLHQAQNLLQSTINSVNRGNISATCGKLGAFINQAQAQSGKTLRVDEANTLIDQATAKRAGCK
jgi:hypothetical protein